MESMTAIPQCKITVLKTLYHQDLAAARTCIRDLALFTEGQEFTVNYLTEHPESFSCDWAWDDIHKTLFTLMLGGSYSNWMKDGVLYGWDQAGHL